ncbi:phospholipase [Parashewanella curva]|uniref:Phospholipase n=1 Tax=Parashewanella curva TaxID=2338552 RepID=A0A3L8PXK8_9GAMM|nr:sphingomyelin phosphodiesterase [Parashewanella curva]RLV60060.1 phospholipase [Parashewanella curva]
MKLALPKLVVFSYLSLLLFSSINIAEAQEYDTYLANNTTQQQCSMQALHEGVFYIIKDVLSSKECTIGNVNVSFIAKVGQDGKVQAGIKTPNNEIPMSNSTEIRRIQIHNQNDLYELSEKITNNVPTFAITKQPNNQFISDANKLSILTYNLWGTSIYGSKKVSERFNEMPKYFHNYDVLAFEEQFDVKPTQALHSALKSEYPYQTEKVKQSGRLLSAGIYILSRYPIIKQSSIVYHSCSGLQCFASKGGLYVEINKNGQKYHIFDTHTQSGDKDKEVNARKSQVKELAQFIKSQGIPDDEPIIIAGDFNIAMHKQQADYDEMLTTLNATHPDSSGYPLTYDTSVNKWADPVQAYFDYLMYGNDHLLPISASLKVIAPRSTTDSLWNYWDLSDHFAVEGVFEFATPAQN